MADKLPTREEFLSYLTSQPGLTPTEAAKEFGIPERTARRWVAADKKAAAERARQNRAKKPSAPQGGPAPKKAGTKPRINLADLSADARELLLGALELRLRHLASEESLGDARAAQSHAIALGILIDKCPDLLKLVGADAKAEGSDDERAKALRKALGLGTGEGG